MPNAKVLRPLGLIVIAGASAVLATYLTAFAYLVLAGGDTLHNQAVLALWIAWVLKLQSACAGVLVGCIAVAFYRWSVPRKELAIGILAAIAGTITMLIFTGHSPHINSLIAAAIGAIAYASVAAVILRIIKSFEARTG